MGIKAKGTENCSPMGAVKTGTGRAAGGRGTGKGVPPACEAAGPRRDSRRGESPEPGFRNEVLAQSCLGKASGRQELAGGGRSCAVRRHLDSSRSMGF